MSRPRELVGAKRTTSKRLARGWGQGRRADAGEDVCEHRRERVDDLLRGVAARRLLATRLHDRVEAGLHRCGKDGHRLAETHVGRVVGGLDRVEGVLLVLAECGRGEERVFEDEVRGEYFAQLDGVLDEDDTELEEEVQEAVGGDVGLAAIARLLAFDPSREEIVVST